MAIAFHSGSLTDSGNTASVVLKGAWPPEMEVVEKSGGKSNTRLPTKENTLDQTVSSTPPRRKRLLLSTESAFVDHVIPSLVANPDVELRLITDEPSALLSGINKVPHTRIPWIVGSLRKRRGRESG